MMRWQLVLVMACVLNWSATTGAGDTAPSNDFPESARIKLKVMQQIDKDWQDKERFLTTILANYADDALIIAPNGDLYRGREQIKELQEEEYTLRSDALANGIAFTFFREVIHEKQVDASTVCFVQDFKVTVKTPHDSTAHVYVSTIMMRKVNDQWKIIFVQSSRRRAGA